MVIHNSIFSGCIAFVSGKVVELLMKNSEKIV